MGKVDNILRATRQARREIESMDYQQKTVTYCMGTMESLSREMALTGELPLASSIVSMSAEGRAIYTELVRQGFSPMPKDVKEVTRKLVKRLSLEKG